MTEIVQYDLGFVNELPKREQTKVQKVLAAFNQLRSATAQHGALVPVPFVAAILGVSRQRVDEMVNDGRVVSVRVNGHVYVPEAAVVAYAQSERKAGRPPKIPSNSQLWNAAKANAVATVKGLKNS